MSSLRIRTLTAGLTLANFNEVGRFESALAFLDTAKQAFADAGYMVQTARIAVTSLLADVDLQTRTQALEQLRVLDRMAVDRGVIINLGPLSRTNRDDPSLPEWTQELVRATKSISFSVVIASAKGVHGRSAAVAANIMRTLAQALPLGVANFRFAAAANIPAGTPFFPVSWHDAAVDTLAVGVESAGLVEAAFKLGGEAEQQLKRVFNEALTPIEKIAMEAAKRGQRTYLGIDTSPAPSLDRSIAAGIEAYTHAPFGGAGTLEACATVTSAIKNLAVKSCGYSGLMLPVLEDPLLADRAAEGRYGLRDLLLFSSVCGTGLDVVPIPGDTSADALTRVLRDVAALSVKLQKALSARLFIVPGKRAGERASFNDPLLTDATIMRVE
jgi:uncharacterized protein (UPF0210 family)